MPPIILFDRRNGNVKHLPLFVYGTLKQGCRNAIFHGKYSKIVHDATTPGALYDLHTGYPGAKFKKDSPPIKGELYFYDDLNAFFDAILSYDLLEGYSPANHSSSNLFTRRVVTVEVGGKQLEAYAYEVTDLRKFPKEYEIIPSGEWSTELDDAYARAIAKAEAKRAKELAGGGKRKLFKGGKR